jgi:hypothetical protein
MAALIHNLCTKYKLVFSVTLSLLYSREKESIHWVGGFVGIRAGLDAVVKRKSLTVDRNRTAIFRSVAYLCTY